jgi:hypothetical protein
MPNKGRPLNLEEFDTIDWDPVEAENSNLAKCMSRGIDEGVVWEVLAGDWVDVEMPVNTAEFVVVGPNEERNQMWTLLFATSSQRGDWLRPVTGGRQITMRLRSGRTKRDRSGEGQGNGERVERNRNERKEDESRT